MEVGNVNLVILIRGKEKDSERQHEAFLGMLAASIPKAFLSLSLYAEFLNSLEMSSLVIHDT